MHSAHPLPWMVLLPISDLWLTLPVRRAPMTLPNVAKLAIMAFSLVVQMWAPGGKEISVNQIILYFHSVS
jgi:hypothetical protein